MSVAHTQGGILICAGLIPSNRRGDVERDLVVAEGILISCDVQQHPHGTWASCWCCKLPTCHSSSSVS